MFALNYLMWHFVLVWSDFFVTAEQCWRCSAPHPAPQWEGWGCTRSGDMRGSIPRAQGVFQTLWHRARCTEQGGEAAGVGSGCLSPQVAVVQRCGARLQPQQFSALCVLLQRVVLLSGAPDADRQWFHKKEAKSFLSSYWREPRGCLRQRRQHWRWAQSRVGIGFHIHHHNGGSCRWWSWTPMSVFFIGLLYLNWILTLFVKNCSRTMTLFRFFYVGNFAKLYVFEWLRVFFKFPKKKKIC